MPIFSAPAKLNLSLRIMGKRADGYHLLQSVMTLFPLYDRLTIDSLETERLEVDCTLPVTANIQDNLVFRAAEQLRQAAGLRLGARIAIEKNIPAGAGLGGGSSDAATTLLALNRLWQLNLDRAALIQIGVTIGADVPFFLYGRSAMVAGIGEQLQPIESLPHLPMVVVYPGVALSTREVFQHFDVEEQLTTHANTLIMPSDLAFFNDLESSAMQLAPVLQDVFQLLREYGAQAVVMSGSGSAVFALFADDASAMHVASIVRHLRKTWRVFSGMTVNVHPFMAEWNTLCWAVAKR